MTDGNGGYAEPLRVSKLEDVRHESKVKEVEEALDLLKLRQRKRVERRIGLGEVRYNHELKKFVDIKLDKDLEFGDEDDDLDSDGDFEDDSDDDDSDEPTDILAKAKAADKKAEMKASKNEESKQIDEQPEDDWDSVEEGEGEASDAEMEDGDQKVNK